VNLHFAPLHYDLLVSALLEFFVVERWMPDTGG